MEIYQIDQNDRKPVDNFIMEHWFTMDMVVHGESINLGIADGVYACDANEIVGLVTYRIVRNEMEILSLDSIHEGMGIGSDLLDKAIKIAKDSGCSRVMLITTNDNLSALQFYQKRGFDIIRLYHNAVEESRKIKPEIPRIASNGIPIRHEIELEMKL
ncbi:MAG: GNAT family N-acetyltransferase [Erysipelotrichaceae bacterium]|nr:GNAT family N-acetyltransferase [Erysipelotrichaceae bacterium]